jgi:hypothetical protein
MRNAMIVMVLVVTAGCTTSFKFTPDGETDSGHDTVVTDTAVDPSADTHVDPTADTGIDTVVDTGEDGFDPHADLDEDGFRPVDGDCDDEDPGINPAAFDVPGNGIDEDCDSVPDNTRVDCDCLGDATLAQGIDICESRFFTDAAVISFAPGADQGRGLLSGYGSSDNGIRVREGCAYTVLGTGPLEPTTDATCDARQPGTDLWGVSAGDVCPGTEPEPNPEGGDGTMICDLQQLAFDLVAPSNVHGFSFDFVFITSEYPEWVGTDFNDTFYAILQRLEPEERFNLVFDDSGGEINASSTFIENPPETSLAGTGYDDMVTTGGTTQFCGSSTGWVRTEAPIRPGEPFSLTFSIHDEGDGIFDSLVIIDNFRWLVETPENVTYKL